MLCEWNSGEEPSEAGKDRAKRGPSTEGGSGVHPKNKTWLQMVQSGLFWSFICEFIF